MGANHRHAQMVLPSDRHAISPEQAGQGREMLSGGKKIKPEKSKEKNQFALGT